MLYYSSTLGKTKKTTTVKSDFLKAFAATFYCRYTRIKQRYGIKSLSHLIFSACTPGTDCSMSVLLKGWLKALL